MGRFKREIKLTIAKEGTNGNGTTEIVTKKTMRDPKIGLGPLIEVP